MNSPIRLSCSEVSTQGTENSAALADTWRQIGEWFFTTATLALGFMLRISVSFVYIDTISMLLLISNLDVFITGEVCSACDVTDTVVL